jgi:hypothetical protein
MMDTQRLNGIIDGGGLLGPLRNPGEHLTLSFHNRVQADVIGPDGSLKQHIDHRDNVLCTHGLNRLIEMLASDAGGASAWVSAAAIGTDTTAANSTQDSLGNSTQIVHLSQASMAGSDAGSLTLQYNCTFASDGNAAAIHEAGLFATNAATANAVARSVLGTDSINRGSADEIRITYQVVAATG